jgi:putative ABC transport system permease protein
VRHRTRAFGDLDQDIQDHLEQETQANVARGMSPEEARYAALRTFGSVTLVKEDVRAVWIPVWLDQLQQDLRYALRTLRRTPGFSLIVVLTLALGIGANTAVFTIANALLFRSLPFDQPDRIMALDTQDGRGRSIGVSLQDFEDWRRASRTLSSMALIFSPGLTIAADDRLPNQYPGAYISAVGFDLIGEKVALGRGFRAEDDRPGAAAVVLLSDSVWKSRYAADPAVIGKTVDIATVPATVIGVMPEGFTFPFDEQVWIPMSQLAPVFQQRGRQARFFFAYGRLALGVTIDQARSELAIIAAQLGRQYPSTNKDATVTITPFIERVLDPQLRTLSWVLMGAVTFVLLIACANVANLLLARSVNRAREIALRTSLGATRWRIVRQLLVESLLLSCLGGGVGLGLALIGVRWFNANTQDVGRPSWMVFTMDGHVLAFFAGVCVITGVLFGLAPAVHLSRTRANDVLRDGGRSATGGLQARRWTGVLIIAELTLTLVLLAGAGFMTRSFLHLYRMDVGFETSHLLTLRIVLPARKYPTFDTVIAFLRRVDDRLNAVSTIDAASTATSVPLFGIDPRGLVIDGRRAAPDEPPKTVMMVSVGPRYFETLGVHLLRGRLFQEGDGEPGHEVAVINQRLAATFFSTEDPIGKGIRLIDDTQAGRQSPLATIVGIAPTIRQRSLQEAPDGTAVVYIPNLQNLGHRNGTMVLVRARADPATLTAQVRQEIFALDPDLPLANINTMDQLLAGQRWSSRVFGTMFGAFAGIAVLLAGVGLYALTAHAVRQRTSEIGVRRALGAQARHIIWLVIRRAVVHVAAGLALGLAGAIGIGRLLMTVLVQTTPTDAVTLLLTAGILVAVAAFACFWPTRRAMALDPAVALRYE